MVQVWRTCWPWVRFSWRGVGHELSFLAFLYCLDALHLTEPSDRAALVLKVFQRCAKRVHGFSVGLKGALGIWYSCEGSSQRICWSQQGVTEFGGSMIISFCPFSLEARSLLVSFILLSYVDFSNPALRPSHTENGRYSSKDPSWDSLERFPLLPSNSVHSPGKSLAERFLRQLLIYCVRLD